jgi:hypothetical protein
MNTCHEFAEEASHNPVNEQTTHQPFSDMNRSTMYAVGLC